MMITIHNLSVSGTDKHRVTTDACCENIAKLIPFSISDTPRGEGFPDEVLRGKFIIFISIASATSYIAQEKHAYYLNIDGLWYV